MLLYGNLNSDKTKILMENYARLLNSGVSAEEILVVVQNIKMKEKFIEGVKKHLTVDALTKFHVYSFFGLCYNFVLEYYPLLENQIDFGNAKVLPNLCGLEVSRRIFKSAIDKLVFKGYNSKVNLLHQLLRRQSLITLNALTEVEIAQKTRILSESFTGEITDALNLYKQKTLELRAFDYLRQVQLFSYIYKNVKNPYKYVFVDDADEITPAFFEYLKFIKDDADFFIAYDPKGSSRKGYLCACENNFELFLNETPVILEESKMADEIFEKIRARGNKAAEISSAAGCFQIELSNLTQKDFIRSDMMVDTVVKEVNSLVNKGVSPGKILIVIPVNDEYLKLFLNRIEAPVNFITGSEKIEDNKTVSALISILKLFTESGNYRISPYKLKGLLVQIFKVDLNTAVQISQDFEADFGAGNLFEILENYKETGQIQKFLELDIREKPLSEMLFALAEEFVERNSQNTAKINGLLKQIRDFEEVFEDGFSKKELLNQLENTIIAENPLEDDELIENAINISTMQKAIDFKIKNKYMFILDTTSQNWMKQDIGPLYNAWVFQKGWIKRDFTLKDNILLAHDKIARSLRKLYLLNEGEIRAYSCVYNFLGIENFKGIKHFFTPQIPNVAPEFKIIPRPDQQPVLDYKNGKLAVMAVAGAGKTTILLALIMKLLENGVRAENIFVLTYMDSAARAFREKIKTCYPYLAELPNISTIHGLSMRILRENNNHAYLGLDADFDIIDETGRLKIISEILYNEGIEVSKVNFCEKTISAYKNSKNKNFLKPLFKRVFKEYQRALRARSLIDYDDLLVLALELLKQNSKIREYYQNMAHFIIEDEAQDSSAIQQELINIVSRKSGNLIRCGDVNQAITGTFSNSDTEGFKRFIKNGPNCKMNRTARNSTGVIELANRLIKRGLELSGSSFFEIETMPVAGKNIVDPAACTAKIFDKEIREKEFVVNKINEIFAVEKNVTAGILTRTNKEVETWAHYIKNTAHYRVTTKNGLLSNNFVYRAVLSAFNFIANPMNNILIADFAKTMMELGFYADDIQIFDKLKKTPAFILNNNDNFAIWWDLRYFLELTALPPYELAFKIGEFYFLNDKKRKANIAPVSSIVAKIFNAEGNFEDTLNKMNDLAKKSGDSRLFEEEEEKSNGQNEVKILTLHKSKGDEYDYVFIPALNSKNLGLAPDDIKLNESAKIIQNIYNLNKTDDELKCEIIDENLRLLYVGITRAKRKLYLSCAGEYKSFSTMKKANPSFAFKLLRRDL